MDEHKLVREIRRSVSELLAAPAGLVVAVSGGPDSVALLSALVELGIPSLTVAHVNHRLRGAAADADEAFVHEMAQKMGIEFRCVTADVGVASGGRNIEATARRLRYEALAAIAHDVEAAAIASGHTADDQAETVLHRIIRGTGPTGLAGILPRRRLGDALLIRPILRVRRSEVMNYLADRGLSYRIDQTNWLPHFTRNRIRAELLPLVETFNPRAKEELARLAELAFEQRKDEWRWAKALLKRCELPRAAQLCIFDRGKLRRISAAHLRLMLRLLWRREGWPRDAMGFREWIRLAEFCRGEVTAIDLPGGIRARQLERVVRIGPGA